MSAAWGEAAINIALRTCPLSVAIQPAEFNILVDRRLEQLTPVQLKQLRQLGEVRARITLGDVAISSAAKTLMRPASGPAQR